jgi:hypothetical protein
VSDVRVEGNRLINNDGADIDLGARYTNRWPARQMILLPENCAIVSNLVVKKAGLEVVSVTEQKMSEPFDIVKFRPNLWMDNVCVGGRLTSQPEVARGFKLNDLTAKSANPFPSPRDYDPTGEDILKEEEIGPAWSTRPPKQSPDH